eukprot:7210284-Lingulodinium_polyedra.AAC.1
MDWGEYVDHQKEKDKNLSNKDIELSWAQLKDDGVETDENGRPGMTTRRVVTVEAFIITEEVSGAKRLKELASKGSKRNAGTEEAMESQIREGHKGFEDEHF